MLLDWTHTDWRGIVGDPLKNAAFKEALNGLADLVTGADPEFMSNLVELLAALGNDGQYFQKLQDLVAAKRDGDFYTRELELRGQGMIIQSTYRLQITALVDDPADPIQPTLYPVMGNGTDQPYQKLVEWPAGDTDLSTDGYSTPIAMDPAPILEPFSRLWLETTKPGLVRLEARIL